MNPLLVGLFGLGGGILDVVKVSGVLPSSAQGWLELLANDRVRENAEAIARLATQTNFDAAIAELAAKHAELRRAKPLLEMTSEEVATCLALSDALQVMRAQNVALAIQRNPTQWVGENLVPILVEAGQLILPVVMKL